MVRTSTGDYSRIEEYIMEIADQIEMEQGERYEDLDKETQTQVILDHFFRGIPQYWNSADNVRAGIAHTVGGGVTSRQLGVKVGRIVRRGRTYRVIRDAQTGRIRQWVSDY